VVTISGMVTAGRVIGLLALVTVVGAGCGTGGSSSTPKVSVGAAAGKPCLLVSLSEATTILGQAAIMKSLAPTASAPAACSFGQSPLTVVLVHIIPAPFAESSSHYISKPAPADGVGHGTVCGPSASLPGYSALVGPVDSGHSLLVDGLTSCATVEKFATVAYSHLQE
jgi:hypothetical protein